MSVAYVIWWSLLADSSNGSVFWDHLVLHYPGNTLILELNRAGGYITILTCFNSMGRLSPLVHVILWRNLGPLVCGGENCCYFTCCLALWEICLLLRCILVFWIDTFVRIYNMHNAKYNLCLNVKNNFFKIKVVVFSSFFVGTLVFLADFLEID